MVCPKCQGMLILRYNCCFEAEWTERYCPCCGYSTFVEDIKKDAIRRVEEDHIERSPRLCQMK